MLQMSARALFWRSMACLLWASAGWGSAMAATDALAVDDAIAPRLKACASCHGDQGRASPGGYFPRIAGKPAGYLYKQLKNFQTGQRKHHLMAHFVDPLSEVYLWEIAQYFAVLEIPYAAPLATQHAADLLRQGEQLVRQGDAARQLPACAACHGTALTGTLPATPGLLGLPRDYLNAQLGAWQTGARKADRPDCMAQVTQHLQPADIAAISAWLSSQPVPAVAKAQVASGAKLPLDCGSFTAPVQPRARGVAR